MPFIKKSGTCCIVLPLKLGVGIITMLAWAHSVVCILALFTGDIRFQANGYNLTTYKLPSIVGAFGIVLGFIGLLGVYDDKPPMIKVFNYWLSLKIAAMLVAMIADYWMLIKCDSWLSTTEHLTAGNVQMDTLAEARVCPWARWAYVIGCVIDLAAWGYFAFRSWGYQWHLEVNPSYDIDFGREHYDKEARWRMYQVKDPTNDMKPRRRGLQSEQQEPVPSYGSMSEGEPEQDQDQEAPSLHRYGPDGQPILRSGIIPGRTMYNPDGTRVDEEDFGFAPAPGSNPAEMVNL